MNTQKFMLSCSGDLVKLADFSVLREKFSFPFLRIKNRLQLRATIRHGKTAGSGGYPMFLIFGDGAACCFDCAKKEYSRIAHDMRDGFGSQFAIVGCEFNFEDDALFCAHCNTKIDSAYGGQDDFNQ